MFRKILIFLTFLFLAALGYFSFKLFREKEVVVNALIDAVPFDASVIFEINRPELLLEIISKPPAETENFLQLPFIHEPLEKLRSLDSLTSRYPDAKEILLRPHAILVSGHLIGKDRLEMVYYFKLNNEKEFQEFDQIIQNTIQAKGNLSEHKYEDARIYDISIFNRKSAGFSYTYYRGMMVLSNSPMLIEEVIRQSKSNISIRTRDGLETILKTSGKSSPFNIYLNFEFFPTLSRSLINSRFKEEVESLGKFAHWIELDCNVQKNAIVLNGFSSAEGSNGFLSDIFKDLQPVNLTLPNLLPSGSKSFYAMGISDYDKFRSNFSAYQLKGFQRNSFEKNLSVFDKTNGTNLASDFRKIFDKEVCVSYFPIDNDTLSKNIFTIIKTKSNSDARQFLSSMLDKHMKADPEKQEITKTGNSSHANIYNTSFANLPELLFGKLFNLNGNKYCTVSDNYLIFGDTIPALNNFVNEFSSQKNLAIDQNYNSLTDLLAEDTYFYFYLSPEATKLYRYFLKYNSEQMFSQYKYALTQVQAIVFQFGRNNDLFYNNAFIRFLPKSEGNVHKVWELSLDAPLNSAIKLVKNHSNQKTEMMCQDKANNLYLISAAGEIEWKRKFDRKILSPLVQVDLFRNKKLQVIFNTEDKIYALDRNGKDIEGFPILLKIKAKAGISVFDYDKTRNYRILLPAKDDRIYCFDKTGKEVPGWKKPLVEGNLAGSACYFAFNGKDYISIYTTKQAFFFDRKGNNRILPSSPVCVAPRSAIFANKTKNNYQFVFTDSTGSLNFISLNGQVTKVKPGVFPGNHYFITADINADQTNDYLYFYDKKYEAYNASGSRMVNYLLDGNIDLPPRIIALHDSGYLFSYTDTSQNKIYLENSLGSAVDGTPLPGNSEITYEILENQSNKLNLYLADKNILYCYSVE